MESLDILNLRAGECSFLEIALADVRHYTETFAPNNKNQVVLVFPPLNARNRFLIHTLVENFFNELNTISIGNSYGRRTVVYHSSIRPMLCETEIDESNGIHDENNTSVYRAYRTPTERKAQEKLFQSLMPKKVDKTPRSTKRKSKRPDIQIYVPKALRGSANNTVSNISRTTNISNFTPPSKPDLNIKNQNDSSNTSFSKKIKDSTTPLNLNSQQNNSILMSLDSFKFVDLSNEMVELQNSFSDVSPQISESLFSCKLPDIVNINECYPNSPVSSEIINVKNPNLENNRSVSSTVGTTFNDYKIVSKSLPQCLADHDSKVCINHPPPVLHLPNFQIPDINHKITANDVLESKEKRKSMDLKVIGSVETSINVNFTDMSSKQQHEMHIGDEIIDSSAPEIELVAEYENNCPHFCLDDSFTSGPLTDIEEKNYNIQTEELNMQQRKIEKKKKKKKVLDLDECSWEDLYDKEDDYIHPLLMKELVSTMGKVQVQCTKEDYRNHQSVEERSGDGECVIEVYGFSSDLKTVDLMNQFAAFRKKHFEIVWVDDTHALAVFESPNLADQALSTPLALVKTRPLRNAIKESKLKAESVVPLPATRPKTCSVLARRLVSSALGLKVNVSPDLLNAERTLLANAKEKKIRDAQLKRDIWNDES